MILTLLLCLSLNACDTVPIRFGIMPFKPTNFISMGSQHQNWRYEDSLGNYIYVDSSTFKIKGDTLVALTGMFKMFRKEGEKQLEFQKDLKVAIDLINAIPDKEKTVKQWEPFARMVKRRGYRIKAPASKKLQAKRIYKTI